MCRPSQQASLKQKRSPKRLYALSFWLGDLGPRLVDSHGNIVAEGHGPWIAGCNVWSAAGNTVHVDPPKLSLGHSGRLSRESLSKG